MLVASHIVPWSANKNYRSDPANGLCLFVEFDAYFDQDLISIDQDLHILITSKAGRLSSNLKNRLELLKGKKITPPLNHKLQPDYIKYHNVEVFDKFI